MKMEQIQENSNHISLICKNKSQELARIAFTEGSKPATDYSTDRLVRFGNTTNVQRKCKSVRRMDFNPQLV